MPRAAERVLAPALLAAAVLLGAGCSTGEAGADASPASSPTATSPSAAPSPPASTAPEPGPAPVSEPAFTGLDVAGTVAQGLRTPWGLTLLPDGSALLTERDTGLLRQVGADGSVRTLGVIPEVVPGGEGGLLGVAVGPGFGTGDDHWVYVYLSAASENRVVRLRWDGTNPPGPPQVILSGIPRAGIHNGGRLAFGPDGMLYVATGDAGGTGRAQDLGSLGGKILRVLPDGSVPADNPYAGSPVFTYGHRNVQGLVWDGQGRLWASEFGQRTWDELNVIQAGNNYGWPVVEGRGGDPRYVDPVAQWPTSEASPSGLAYARGTVFMAGLRGARLWAVPVAGGAPTAYLAGEYGRLRTVTARPDGSLWLVTSNTDGRGQPREGDDRILHLTLR